MIPLRSTVCIDAPASKVWEQLCSLEEISRWSAPILKATCPDGRSSGIGAQRVCLLRGGIKIHESWIEWNDEQKYFKYEATGIPIVKYAANRWSVQVHSPTQSLLIAEAEIELRGGVIAQLFLEPIMRNRMNAMGQQSLAALKYLIETGNEYDGKHADLPVPQVAC